MSGNINQMAKKKKQKKKEKSKGYPVKRNLIISGIVLIISSVLIGVATRVDGFAQWYSTNVYPVLVTTMGRFFGWFPFSVSEIILYIILLYVLGTLISTVVLMFFKEEKGLRFLKWLTSTLLIASILFCLFVVNCGINYHRDSFAEVSGLEVREYSVEELLQASQWLTQRVNETSQLVPRDEDGVMMLTVNVRDASRVAMRGVGEEFPALRGYVPPPKPMMNSWLLSSMQVAGIFIPFTIEGNYNWQMVPYNIPFAATHELVHVLGFMAEDEANFIAFLACIRSEEVEFQYSGYLRGWIYVRNALRRVDAEAADELFYLFDEGVKADLAANREFWARFDGPVADLQTRVNDAYLRANAQHEGVRSYGMMVDLLLAYYLQGIHD